MSQPSPILMQLVGCLSCWRDASHAALGRAGGAAEDGEGLGQESTALALLHSSGPDWGRKVTG